MIFRGGGGKDFFLVFRLCFLINFSFLCSYIISAFYIVLLDIKLLIIEFKIFSTFIFIFYVAPVDDLSLFLFHLKS